jgi:hypothetical protein
MTLNWGRPLRAFLLGVTLISPDLQAQTSPQRTSDGRPDMQGVWDFATLTPLQRPRELATKPFLTEEEASQFVERLLREQETDRPLPNGPIDARTFSQLAFNEFWWERAHSLTVVDGRIRSSLIIDPPDGRLPALTPEAEKGRVAQQQIMGSNIADDPERRLLAEQCLSTHAGPPLLPSAETSFLQLVQTSDYVVIAPETSNGARIVALEARPHLPASIRSWRGDSRGLWEGDTLVVDSSNIRLNETLTIGLLPASDATFHLVERFTMVNIDTLLYEFTVNAPSIFVTPWTGAMAMKRTTSRMFEYACHEGNYGLPNILRGARFQDRAGTVK